MNYSPDDLLSGQEEVQRAVWAAAFSAAALRLVAHPTSKATARVCELEADRAVELYLLLRHVGLASA